jgi:hypothetical protein
MSCDQPAICRLPEDAKSTKSQFALGSGARVGSSDKIQLHSPGGWRHLFAMILRVYSYFYHLVLSIFLLGLSIVAMSSSTVLKMPMLPWTGSELLSWLSWGSVFGLISIALAVTGIFRFLFPLWALAVLVLMVQGYLLKSYTFAGRTDFYVTLWLIGGALLAFLGSLTLLGLRRSRRA